MKWLNGRDSGFWIFEAVVQRYSVKTVFLKISQNSQEKTCARVSFLIKLQASALVSFTEHLGFCAVFRRYRIGRLAKNGLRIGQLLDQYHYSNKSQTVPVVEANISTICWCDLFTTLSPFISMIRCPTRIPPRSAIPPRSKLHI